MFRSAPKRTIVLALGLLLASAMYLAFVRGAALLIDLSAMAGMFCF